MEDKSRWLDRIPHLGYNQVTDKQRWEAADALCLRHGLCYTTDGIHASI